MSDWLVSKDGFKLGTDCKIIGCPNPDGFGNLRSRRLMSPPKANFATMPRFSQPNVH